MSNPETRLKRKEIDDLLTRFRLSIQRALLGAITPGIRMITIGIGTGNSMHILAYFDHVPTEDDIEDIHVVSTEVLTDEFLSWDENLIECRFSLAPRKDLEVLSSVVYARKD